MQVVDGTGFLAGKAIGSETKNPPETHLTRKV